MDYSKTQGIISQPLYMIKSKALWLIFPSAINLRIRGTSASTALIKSRTVLQTDEYASSLQRLVMLAYKQRPPQTLKTSQLVQGFSTNNFLSPSGLASRICPR